MKKIMFVCTGNTCRSPMAEALAQKEIEKEALDIEVTSRGIAVYFPSGANEYAYQAMEEYKIDLSNHISRQLEPRDIEDSDIILTMTNQHKQYLHLHFPNHQEKIFTLKEFVKEVGDVEDPFGGKLQEYKSCAKKLEQLIKKTLDEIRQNV